MSKIKVLIVEDNEDIKQNLKDIFEEISPKYTENEQRFEIVGILSNGLELVYYLRNNNHADIVLLDLEMPVMDGITALKELKSIRHKSRIIIYSQFDNPIKIINSLKYNALGFISKQDSFKSLFEGIFQVINNKIYLSPKVHTSYSNLEDVNQNFVLSKREMEILDFLMKGNTNQKIAQNLFISPDTVQNHKKMIFKKLDVSNFLELLKKVKDLNWY